MDENPKKYLGFSETEYANTWLRSQRQLSYSRLEGWVHLPLLRSLGYRL